jgi:type IV secretory pathway VirB10-like protein
VDTPSIIAIAVAVLVAVIGLARSSAAQRQLGEVREELEAAKRELAEAQKKLRALEPPAKPAKKKKPAPKPPPPPPEEPEAPEAPEEPEEPGLDMKEVSRRAEKMLKDARLMARHVGFDNQIEVKGKKGIRVSVQVEDEIDAGALEHLRTTADAVLDAGEDDGEHYVIVKG